MITNHRPVINQKSFSYLQNCCFIIKTAIFTSYQIFDPKFKGKSLVRGRRPASWVRGSVCAVKPCVDNPFSSVRLKSYSLEIGLVVQYWLKMVSSLPAWALTTHSLRLTCIFISLSGCVWYDVASLQRAFWLAYSGRGSLPNLVLSFLKNTRFLALSLPF